ncbi:hypothetical protein BaRGS_00022768 [Batillaria attramentaria]|uniref:Uncharacterized protein n=1 Tax=Batillaria attramentaria TaxID=370345 RepID=A0ABD0KG43_9CAEN
MWHVSACRPSSVKRGDTWSISLLEVEAWLKQSVETGWHTDGRWRWCCLLPMTLLHLILRTRRESVFSSASVIIYFEGGPWLGRTKTSVNRECFGGRLAMPPRHGKA